jgi:hypothetical protein
MSYASYATFRANLSAVDVGGTVTYSGLEALLTDLDSKLALSQSSLTWTEFSRIETIVRNLDNGKTTSPYLTSIMNALVNGDASNATWTGGAASSTSLGNLAVGSSAIQLSELIGKWFLGSDLPSSNVSMDGSNFYVFYSASSNQLFGASGPSINDVNQGYLGDCYLLSSLAEVAQQDAGLISSMFTSNGNNTYGVRFYVDGTPEYVTVNNSLAYGGSAFNQATDIWASLAEKAYAQLQAGGNITGNAIAGGNSWSAIGNGGAAEYALEEITGASAITDFVANGNSWADVVYNSSLAMTSYSSGNSTFSTLDTLIYDLAQGDDLILSSNTNASSGGYTTLIADHAMSIYGYDNKTGMLEIRNPWGTAAGQTWDTTFEVSLSTLLSDGDTITADNVGTNSAAGVLAVQAATQAQSFTEGEAVNFTLAANTFKHPGEPLTLSATLSNGSPLPAWLTFNATTHTFSGTAPTTASTLNAQISVKAVDSSGSSATETFSASIVSAASQLTQSSSAMTSSAGSASAALSHTASTTSPTLSSPLH